MQTNASPLLIDTHCHLVSERLRDGFDELVANARRFGVGKIINIAYDPESIALAEEQIKKSDMVYAAFGIQPHDSHTYSHEVAEAIRLKLRNNNKAVAVGEIGLDNYHKDCSPEVQIPCFEHFLQIAVDEKLPVVVHVRESHEQVASRIRAFANKGLRGVIHCFTGTLAEAREFLELGMYISFSGIVTFKNSDALREVAAYVPADRYLIETDSPYLAPVPERGKTNEPAWVKHVATCIAEVRKESFDDVARASSENAERLFTRLKNLNS